MLLAIVIAFVVNNPKASRTSQQTSLVSAELSQSVTNPLDQLSSADIAVNVASATRLTEATAVKNQADSENALLSITPADDKVVARPQVVVTARKSNKDIKTYTTKEGDTISSIASDFGVSSDSIRWSNGLTGDTVTVGAEIVIPPSGVNGIVYTVKQGDTPDSLAEKYRTNKDLIIAYNDAEISGLVAGARIIIPDGQQPIQRSANTGIYSGASFAWGGFSPIYGSNGYDYGYCTWYAAVKRAQSGHPLPSNLGNASSWKILAQRAGFGVGNSPAAGAVIWTPPRDYYGHVGYVESVDPDGTVHISEMNTVGWGRVSTKTLTPEQAAAYSYIY
ncbi:LysM peptidoglycan-binding domain-containing protein [Candidatus Saccharibacteria bacterium]|nr:LysM peptidoglycan-binding domain-containing protein [Candidatus Saccharibacteria bacterium]